MSGVPSSSHGRYQKIKHLGEGQFANVYKAKDADNNDFVAIKKIKLGNRTEAKDGINRTALREIKLMQELHHDNIIELRDVIGGKTNIQLVMDFMDFDMEHIIKDPAITLTMSHIKNLMVQTFSGLLYLHRCWILHRDLKPNNLLINAAGVLKLADFGLARYFGSPTRVYTHQVVTRWYRCPELLLGARAYGTSVDIWAVGCILAELLLRTPIFPGESDIDQLVKIFDMLGTPTEDYWPNISSLPDYVSLKPSPGIPLRHVFTAASQDTLDLITHCFCFDPMSRTTCDLALQMPFFTLPPFPCENADIPLPGRSMKRAATTKRRRPADGNEPVMRKRLAF